MINSIDFEKIISELKITTIKGVNYYTTASMNDVIVSRYTINDIVEIMNVLQDLGYRLEEDDCGAWSK